MSFATQPGEPSRLPGLRILLADDHPIVRHLARQALESAGFTVESAVNGQDAVDRVVDHGERLDAVLMDLRMPVKNGYEASLEIRRRYSREQLPIFALSIDQGPEEREQCLAAGMNAQISKPIDIEQLRAALASAASPGRETPADHPPRAPAPSRCDTARPFPEGLPGIDVSDVLARTEGNRRLVGQLFRLFIQEHAAAARDIEQLIRAGALAEAAQRAHRLRGAAANLAAARLQAAAQALERDLQAGDVSGSEHGLHGFRQALAEARSCAESIATTMEERDAASGPEEAPPTREGADGSQGPRPRDPAGRAAILLVDDEPAYTHLLQAILEDTYDLFLAADGHEALRIAAASMPDLILLDVMMPEMDGYEVLRRLQADPLLASLPVIFVTARHEEADEAAGLALGAVDYVSKPFNPTIVRLRVRSQIALKQRRDQLTQLSQLDALTGVANRRALDETLEREWRRGLRSRRPLSLVMIDIDRFKAFNDGGGHLAGDNCLQTVARALRAKLQRAGDRLGRYGGDEFLAILPDTDPAGAWALGQEMCAAVAALRIPHPAGSGAFVTISVGVATAQSYRQQNLTGLQQAVDEAMYWAKRGGRNRVEAATAVI